MVDTQAHDVIDVMINDLAAQQPIETALCIGPMLSQDHAITWQYFSATAFLNLPFQQRFDLGLVFLNHHEVLELERAELSQILVKLRDLMAKRLVVVALPAQAGLMRALGFTQILHTHAQSELQLWQFNILTYKHIPDWLNAKFWANPENWDKYRW